MTNITDDQALVIHRWATTAAMEVARRWPRADEGVSYGAAAEAALRALDHCRPRHLDPYVARVCRRAAWRATLRARHLRCESLMADPASALHWVAPDPYIGVDVEDAVRALGGAGAAILSCVLSGWYQREIAQFLGVSQSEISRRLAQARAEYRRRNPAC